MLSGTGQARAAPLKSLLYISSLARLNLWNGLLGGWDFTIKGWIKDIYGIDLDSAAAEERGAL